MANLLIFVAFFALSATALVNATARPLTKPFTVFGSVYCDTCKCGFETPATTYIAGAKIRVECKDRDTLKLVYSVEALTDATGSYEVKVADDHGEQLCDSVLVSSPEGDCNTVAPGRDRARVILTNNNGINSYKRFANNMGFVKDNAVDGCAELLKLYQEDA